MDTVTETAMAIAMARNGGIGFIHRFVSIEEQVDMVRKVKRAESMRVDHPYTCTLETTLEDLNILMEEHGVHSILVTSADNKLLGIVTTRDTRFVTKGSIVKDFMTPRERLIVCDEDTTIEQAKEILDKKRIEKLPVVDKSNNLRGLYTSKDILNHMHRPYASLDPKGRLLVGAAIGVKNYLDRARRLIEAEVDLLVVDIAHGHSSLAIEATKTLKKTWPHIEVVAGNVCTEDGARDLCLAGADAVKVGVGPGSICITRLVTGCGVPQITAVIDCVRGCKPFDVPLIADGGIRTSGDIVKALACGAATVMLGSRLAGTDESPGMVIVKDGKKVKIVRGMAGYGANMSDKQRRQEKDDIFDLVPEGVEAQVPYRGAVQGIIHQLVGGIKSGISYVGGHALEDIAKNATIVRITGAGKTESGTHDVNLV